MKCCVLTTAQAAAASASCERECKNKIYSTDRDNQLFIQ
jgi:hypothetical protein